MSHVRNIKEMLNIPTGSRNVGTSCYSSLTDSQLFFGSQFWLDNSQGTSQDVSLSSRNSQQSSQEGSEPKIFNSYHSKPPLFRDFKDKSRTSGLLERFEEDRKKAKEKNDSDVLVKEFQQIRETLISIQQLVAGNEKQTAVSQRVFEKIVNFPSAVQNILEGLQSDISQKFETLVDKLSSQKGLMTELEDRVQKHANTTAQLESHLQSITNSLECLRKEHKGERQMLEETLKLLNVLVSKYSAKPSSEPMMDSVIQTSPELEGAVSNKLQDDQLEDSQPTSASLNVEKHQVGTSQGHRPAFRKRRFSLDGHSGKKRPLVLPKKNKLSVSDENSQSAKKCIKLPTICKPLHERHDQNILDIPCSDNLVPAKNERSSSRAAGCFITPLSCWSQDSSSSDSIAIEPILEKLSAESKAATPAKDGDFLQLFDFDLGI